MLLKISVVMGVLFGILAAASAALIVFREYQRHRLSARQIWRISATAALLAFLAFLSLSIAAGYVFSHLQ